MCQGCRHDEHNPGECAHRALLLFGRCRCQVGILSRPYQARHPARHQAVTASHTTDRPDAPFAYPAVVLGAAAGTLANDGEPCAAPAGPPDPDQAARDSDRPSPATVAGDDGGSSPSSPTSESGSPSSESWSSSGSSSSYDSGSSSSYDSGSSSSYSGE